MGKRKPKEYDHWRIEGGIVVMAPDGIPYTFKPLGIRVGPDGKDEAMTVERSDGLVGDLTLSEFAILHHFGYVPESGMPSS